MYSYPYKLEKLINEISKLPGIGPKMAERISLHILKKGEILINELNEALSGVKDVKFCSICGNVSTADVCPICLDERRDRSIICVVESPEDIITVEKTGKHKGIYHVLHGLINPLNNILPENLKIAALVKRASAQDDTVKELILAINHTVEGDATSLYISDKVKEVKTAIRITRLAKGLPTGSDIKYADEITLGQAIIERKEI
jgi:recombination protein RecR